MTPKSISASISDANKTKEQLLSELHELRVLNAYLEERANRAEQLETILETGEDISRLLMEQALYGVWVNVDGKIAFINKIGARILGASDPGEIVGKSALDEIIHPDYRNVVSDRIEAMKHDNVVPVIEEKYLRVDGIAVDVDVWAMQFVYMGEPAILVAFRDITERKHGEEALRHKERQLAEAQEMTETGSWELDLDTGKVMFSDNLLRMLHLSPGEHKLDEFQNRVHPEDRERRNAAIRDSIDNGKRYDIEYRIILPDNNMRYFHAVGRVTNDPQGNPEKLTATIQDITERKQAELEIIKAKQEAELYVDLMGHDINNMHQVALGFLELAHNIIEIEGKLDRDNIILLDKAIDSLGNSARLIDNVRKLQREKTGLYKLEVMDLGETLKSVCLQFKQVPNRYVNIICGVAKGRKVRANELLRDVFTNLIGNAIKHSKGPLIINVQMNTERIGNKKYYAVAIEDNGPGIPDDLKKTLFNRLDLTETRARGKGFGLTLIKMLVDDFHGKFCVEDRVKGDHTQGARFVVLLPAVEK